ncbi:MAG TPA: hypothetical protein VMN36_00610, partial [Verrucomicrobiales bacterium]|nr:hypothetical protein [Verrucomicrobiales bacterium]
METATSTPEKQAKLLRLALDPAAPEGEAVAAFLKFKRAVLREGSSAVWFGGQAAAPAPPIPGFA